MEIRQSGLAVAALLGTVASLTAQADSALVRLLTEGLGFTAADVRTLDAGASVIRSLDTPVREELAHVGAVYVAVPAERFLERFRDIEEFEHGPGVPQIGRFSSVPRLADLASLTLPPADVTALRSCRPGSCGVKLSAAWMQRFRTDVDWSSANVRDEVHEIFREMILDLVRSYRAEGNAALGHYDDGDTSLAVAEQFRALLAGDDPLPVPVPELLAYLHTYPLGRPAAAEDFFYWAVVDFGLKRTVRVNHVTIHPLAAGSPSGVSHVIAIKQLYASHYFHSTLELRFLIDDDRESGPRGATLVSITRSRSDGMTGLRGLFLRPIISRRSRDGVRGYLDHVKRQVERVRAVD